MGSLGMAKERKWGEGRPPGQAGNPLARVPGFSSQPLRNGAEGRR